MKNTIALRTLKRYIMVSNADEDTRFLFPDLSLLKTVDDIY